MNIKKKPVRKCVACRKQSEKSDFLRIVRLKTGEILIDYTGKQNGRGAYICKDMACFEKAQKESSLQRAFKCNVSEQSYEEIRQGLIRVTED